MSICIWTTVNQQRLIQHASYTEATSTTKTPHHREHVRYAPSTVVNVGAPEDDSDALHRLVQISHHFRLRVGGSTHYEYDYVLWSASEQEENVTC